MPPEGGILVRILFLGVLALLVSDAAAGLASRLARGLALTATAVLCALAKVASLKSLDVFHDKPPNIVLTNYNTFGLKSQYQYRNL
jgi:hypothetical protein